MGGISENGGSSAGWNASARSVRPGKVVVGGRIADFGWWMREQAAVAA
ncbi:MAG: hypothetical protein ACTFAL_08430 [Candidatus Electronema sp. V4]